MMATSKVNKIKKHCLSFIPECVSDRTVLRAFRLMGSIDDYSFERACSDYRKNLKVWKMIRRDVCTKDGFIENQASLWKMRFGVCSTAYSGCEVIAAYNVLNELYGGTKRISLPKLIMYFELNGMTMRGRFGTSPHALKEYFICRGFRTWATTDTNEFDEYGSRFTAFILILYNDRHDISKGVHTMAITKEICSTPGSDTTISAILPGSDTTISAALPGSDMPIGAALPEKECGAYFTMHNAHGGKQTSCTSIGECAMKYSAQARMIMLIGIR